MTTLATVDQQLAFYERQWPAMREALEANGAEGLLAYIERSDDDLERRVLFVFARRGVVMGEWNGKNLDAAITIARAGIAEMLRQADTSIDEETRRARVNLANVISYDLSADLADCWPGDDVPRRREHFEEGLRAAEDAIRWREELERGPRSRSMAWWAKGMHQLSLGDMQGAVASWERSLADAMIAADEEGMPLAADFNVVVGSGYLGLARWLAGDDGARRQYGEAISAFAAQLADEDLAEDARFGVEQLEKVRARYAPSL